MLKYLLKNTITLTSILALTQLSLFLSNVLIARFFGREELGIFSFINSSVLMVAAIAGRGYPNAFARYFSNHNITEFKWRRYLMKVQLKNGALAVAISFAMMVLHNDLQFLHFIIISASAAAMIAIAIPSRGIIRPNGRLNIAMIFERGWRILFIFLILSAAFWQNHLTFLPTSILIPLLYSLSLILFGSLSWLFSFASFPEGLEDISDTMRKDANVFWLMAIAMIAMLNLDKLFIGKYRSFEDLGLYTAIFSLMGLFSLISYALGYILLPHFARLSEIRLGKYLALLFVLGFSLVIFYTAFGKYLIFIFFGESYMSGLSLITIFSYWGMLQILDCIPSSLIAGVMERKHLRIQAMINICLAVLFPAILIPLIKISGIRGAAWAITIVFTTKIIAGYSIIYRTRHIYSHIRWS